MAFSVVIPSYRNPEYLDLCLRSAFQNQTTDNQIIVVLDGYADESEHIVTKYKNLNVVAFEENRGQQVAHNTGVTLADCEHVLVVNDDNVFPRNWDKKLSAYASMYPDAVWAPNQIEPLPSIFQSFIHKDFGRTPSTFDYEAYLAYAGDDVGSSIPIGNDGQTWPLFISKRNYMMLGGIDVSFPSPAVADWDFFFRCELAGLRLLRANNLLFYHFAGAATKATPERAAQHAKKEQESHEYFAWKWGQHAYLEARTHNKRPLHGRFRGNLI